MNGYTYSIFLEFEQAPAATAEEINQAIATFLVDYVAAYEHGHERHESLEGVIWHDLHAFGRRDGDEVLYCFTIRYELTPAGAVRYGQLIDASRGAARLLADNTDFVDRLLAEALPAAALSRAIWLCDETDDSFDYIFTADLGKELVVKAYNW